MSNTMKFRLKHGAARKHREQLYLALFFAFIIWVLMAFLFVGDSHSQAIILYLAGSLVIIPYLYKKHIRPYMENLTANTESAFFEIDNTTVTFNHIDNVKHFDRRQIDFQIEDIVNLKKAFRKDNSVNKITLTVKNRNKVKIVVEDFENMEQLVEVLMEKMAERQHTKSDSN